MDKLEQALTKARKLRTKKYTPRFPSQPAALGDPVSALARINKTQLERGRIIAYRSRNSEADAFRILRARILQTMSESNFKTLAITSPNYGEGKTTIAFNLAISIALDEKQTVLLADIDLRKPSIGKLLGIEAETGLSDYLLHDTPMQECLLRTSLQRLAILPGGKPIDNSSEALASPKMSTLAREIKERYDDRIIIYDMPPVLAQDDPIAFLPHVDAVLLIADEGVTKVNDIKRSLNLLADANVIGSVLNRTGGKAPFSELLEKLQSMRKFRR